MSTDEQRELATQDPTVESPRSDSAILLSEAIAANLDIDKLTKFIDLQNQQEDRHREQAFLRAMASFQKKVPVIPHDKKAPWGSYASYGQIKRIVDPLLGTQGLSTRHRFDYEKGLTHCVLTHRDGHSEESDFPLTVEGQAGALAKMSKQHQHSAASTHSRRESYIAVTGIGTSEDDFGSMRQEQASDKNEDVLARTATTAEYEALKAGWFGLARPDEIRTVLRADFDALSKPELAELFMAWVRRSVEGVADGFVHHDTPRTCFTSRQIVDLWAIINKDKEDKVDASAEQEEGRSDSD